MEMRSGFNSIKRRSTYGSYPCTRTIHIRKPCRAPARLIATLTVTGSVFLIEVVSAVLTGSLALLVDAGHMLTDMSVLAASTITAILMRRKPSNTRDLGLAVEVLTAAAGAVVLLVVGIYALMEAGMRLFGGSKAEIDDIGLLLFVGILVLPQISSRFSSLPRSAKTT